MRSQTISSCLRAVLLAGFAALFATCSSAPQDDLPPLVYMCPMVKDFDVLQDHAGKCPKCGMELKPVRIVQAYSCLNNTAFIQATPGKCVTNGTDLVPITASMFWACAQSPDKHELTPGKCADGSSRIQKFEPRLHGDHNPRHGGQLFMADDGWHHVEGTYPEAGLLRVYFYDDWTRALAPTGFEARAIIKDSAGRETAQIPLKETGGPNSLDAKIPKSPVPLSVSLVVRFKPGEAEKSFDFTFKEYSSDSSAPPQTTAVTPAPAPVATAPIVQTAPPQASVPNEIPPGLSPTNIIPTGTFQLQPIPSTAREILAEMDSQSMELAQKIEQRAPLGEYWVPALRTKDLALALVNDHQQEIPAGKRAAAENAARRLLRTAYAIDNFGDLGDFEKIVSAHEEFALALTDLRAACASIK